MTSSTGSARSFSTGRLLIVNSADVFRFITMTDTVRIIHRWARMHCGVSRNENAPGSWRLSDLRQRLQPPPDCRRASSTSIPGWVLEDFVGSVPDINYRRLKSMTSPGWIWYGISWSQTTVSCCCMHTFPRSVNLVTNNYGSFVQLLSYFRRMPPRRYSMHLFHRAWTIAICCCTALLTDYCRSCSQFKLMQQLLSQQHGYVITSRQCYWSFTTSSTEN